MNENLFPPIYIFVAWVLLLAALITVIMVFRWRHPDRHSRFQLKLTLGPPGLRGRHRRG